MHRTDARRQDAASARRRKELREMWRSVAAVAGGFLGMIVVVTAGTAAAAAALVPGGMSMSGPPAGVEVPRAYLAANLIVSFAGAALGGWLAGRFAPGSAFSHAAVLAGLVLLMGVASGAGGASPGQPGWYPWIITITGVAGVLAGGAVAGR
jgi:hypothetical protein